MNHSNEIDRARMTLKIIEKIFRNQLPALTPPVNMVKGKLYGIDDMIPKQKIFSCIEVSAPFQLMVRISAEVINGSNDPAKKKQLLMILEIAKKNIDTYFNQILPAEENPDTKKDIRQIRIDDQGRLSWYIETKERTLTELITNDDMIRYCAHAVDLLEPFQTKEIPAGLTTAAEKGLFAAWTGQVVTRDQGNNLYNNYCEYADRAKRRGDPLSAKKLKNKINLFEKVFQHLPEEAQATAETDIAELKRIQEEQYS